MNSPDYELILKYRYSINSSLVTIEKKTSYDTSPTSSEIRNRLIDWFEEIDVDLDIIQNSETIQISNSDNTNRVFNYDPEPIDT